MIFRLVYLSLYSVFFGALVGSEVMLLGETQHKRPWGWAFLLAAVSAIVCQLGVEFLAPPF